jgi:hypothetical protein
MRWVLECDMPTAFGFEPAQLAINALYAGWTLSMAILLSPGKHHPSEVPSNHPAPEHDVVTEAIGSPFLPSSRHRWIASNAKPARCRHARQNNRLAKIWPKSWQILAALSHPSFPNQVATKTKLVAVTIRHGWIAPCYRFAGTQLAPGSMLWHRLSAS